MMKWFKEHKYATLFLLLAGVAIAAGTPHNIPSDVMKFGIGSSPDSKQIVVDVGDGGSNPSITVDTTNKDFDLNKSLNVTGTFLSTGDATIQGNSLTLGDGSASDKDFVFDLGLGAANPLFRWDNTEAALSFANNGVDFKKIGSGSGGAGGVNALAENNFDFESGSPPSDWTASGGTFISETTSPLFGDQSGSWDASALSQTLDSVLAPITSGYLGRVCQAEIVYNYAAGASGDYRLVARVFDDSGASEADIAVIDLNVTGTDTAKAQLSFDCPDDVNDDLRVRVIANVADPGIIIVDDAFIGVGNNSFDVSQTTLVARVHYPEATNCTWPVETGGSFTSFPADADCLQSVVDFSTIAVDTTEDDIPNLIFPNLPKGTYVIKASYLIGNGTANVNWASRIWDGTNEIAACGDRIDSTAEESFIHCSGVVTYSGPGPRTFEIQGRENHAAGMFLQNDFTGQQLAFEVWRVPTNDAKSITLETVGENWNVSIGGANPNLTLASVSPPAAVSDAGLDMVINDGSASAKIPCDGGNTATGLTCSAGNETVGIVITPKTAGRYKMCATFGHQYSLATTNGCSLSTGWRWVETTLDGTSVVKTGSNIVNEAESYTGSSSAENVVAGVRLCEEMNFNSVSERRLEVYREQLESVASCLSANQVNADRLSTVYERDINITVQKMDQQFPTPVFTDLQNSLNLKMDSDFGRGGCWIHINNTGTPAIDVARSDSCASSVTDNAVGDTTVNFSQTYSVEPVCVCTVVNAGDNRDCHITAETTSSVRVLTENRTAAGDLDTDFNLFCGVRP